MKETERGKERQTEEVNNSQLLPGWLDPQCVASDWTMIRLTTIWVTPFDQETRERCQSHFKIRAQHLHFQPHSHSISLHICLIPSPALHLSFSLSLVSCLCRNNITAGVRGFASECGRGLFLGQSEWAYLGLHAVLPHHLGLQALPHWRFGWLLQLPRCRPERSRHLSWPHRLP